MAVVEGVMGLFDGQLGTGGFGSTARVATLLGTPLVLVLDVSAASRTAAAVVHGLHTFDPDVRLAGVILNKAGSERHSAEVIDALQATGLPVLGVLPRDAGIEVPSRHLGLVTAAEQPASAQTVRRLGERVAAHLDLTALLALAHTAPPLDASPWDPAAAVASLASPAAQASTGPVIAVAGGRAFTFRYAETDELLRAAGCEPVEFDPLSDPALPPGTAGLYLGGGFPEVYAAQLSANTELRSDIAGAIAAGLPTVAECAGLLYLCSAVDGLPMVGTITGRGAMTDRLTLGYRVGVAPHDSLLGPAGTRVSGHEFHRTVVDGLDPGRSGWLLARGSDPASAGTDGTANAGLHASYLHVHWAGHPELAGRFAQAVHEFAAGGRHWQPGPVERPPVEPDLDHHGDAELADGLVDLAVNVRVPAPPRWLADTIAATIDELAAYPDAGAATLAIAAAHPELSPGHVLPTAGAAESFTLIARAFTPRHAVVVHPQFTEPEAALRAAGHRVHRVLLGPEGGFRLEPELIAEDADLVIVGNPTNPTGVLHPRAAIRALARPGRLIVVDEAFMDAVPGEPETLLDGVSLARTLVLRSLTKTWGVAGLRAGYVVGDPDLVSRLRDQQPPWSTSTPALAVIQATLTAKARELATESALELVGWRDRLVTGLAGVGLPVAGQPQTPFVLVDVRGWDGVPVDTIESRADGAGGWLRQALRERGFAVRRCDTFPGLDGGWLRLAVRDPDTTDALIAALRAIRAQERAR